MPRGPRKRPRSPKEIKKIREDEQAQRDVTPSDRQRKIIIQLGVGVLLIAFLTTSGSFLFGIGSSMMAKPDSAENITNPQQTELDHWRKEAQEKPNDPSVLANLADYLIIRAARSGDPTQANKDYAEASGDLQSALKIDKDYPFAIRLMGRMSLAQGKYDDAAKYFQQGLGAAAKPIDPKDKDKDSKEQSAKAEQIEDHLGLAAAAEGQKKLPESLKQFDEALKIDPGAAQVYMMRAGVYHQQGQNELARKDLETVSKIGSATQNISMVQEARAGIQMLDKMAATPTPGASATPGAPSTPIQVIPPQVNPADQQELASPALTTPTPGAPVVSTATPSAPVLPAAASPTPAPSSTP